MITLAIPNKGRINADILRLLEKIGLDIPENGRKLYVNTNNPAIKIAYARAADIPLYVQSKAADLGITGEDMINESKVEIEKLLKLNFDSCKIAVAVSKDFKFKSFDNFEGNGKLKVATKLVNIAKKYFDSKKIDCEIIRISGATELAPYLGIADVIVDQVSTGTTLSANNLRIIDTIFESSIWLVANPKSIKEKQIEIDEIKIAIESVITAEQKRYVMANVRSESDLKRVISSMPSMESPTILNLAKKGEYAIHTAIDSKELIATIRKMKQAGAKDILVMTVSRAVG